MSSDYYYSDLNPGDLLILRVRTSFKEYILITDVERSGQEVTRIWYMQIVLHADSRTKIYNYSYDSRYAGGFHKADFIHVNRVQQ